MKPYERLLAWQRCHELAIAVYRETGRWPKSEQYGLTAQLRRAATSVAANIAEGSAKRGHREFRRYLDIALGSLSEVTYLLHLARELDYVDEPSAFALTDLANRAGQLTWRLYQRMASA